MPFDRRVRDAGTWRRHFEELPSKRSQFGYVDFATCSLGLAGASEQAQPAAGVSPWGFTSPTSTVR
jgi:hypothetical protein